ncbi:hypothetical protein SBA5_330021 [Candidatus Sulfotelmatomonas gaucii]|uniref:Uncharacterized protein n=1 Tax=Candidatus Sulfuritelmatomonas gaucii TaxID=2043161 RepID=A0A2N9LFD2_9BACT|nr:hypothetical protein SBA5_330021 [Candidatus Sulfotelmatomonas gaucii]
MARLIHFPLLRDELKEDGFQSLSPGCAGTFALASAARTTGSKVTAGNGNSAYVMRRLRESR